jgi:hypothetical protein
MNLGLHLLGRLYAPDGVVLEILDSTWILALILSVGFLQSPTLPPSPYLRRVAVDKLIPCLMFDRIIA